MGGDSTVVKMLVVGIPPLTASNVAVTIFQLLTCLGSEKDAEMTPYSNFSSEIEKTQSLIPSRDAKFSFKFRNGGTELSF